MWYWCQHMSVIVTPATARVTGVALVAGMVGESGVLTFYGHSYLIPVGSPRRRGDSGVGGECDATPDCE
jgi:hypothetical protein